MKSKAIIFDIDGTAIDSPDQKLPSKRLIEAAKQIEDKYYLCAATGRVWSFAKQFLQAMELEDPCIISGGTQICNPKTGEILWQSNLDRADVESALEILRQYPEYKLLCNDYEESEYLHGGGTLPQDFEIKGPVFFLEQAFVPKEVAPEIVKKLSKIEGASSTLVVAQREGFNDIHVTNKDATKEHALAELLKIIKVDKNDTIGVGDGHNDIHLFRAVGHKVAMDNSVPELKEKADEVIGSIKDDGFAVYLEKLLN